MTPRTRLLAYIYIVMCGGFLAVGIVVCVGLMLSRDPSSGRALEVVGGGFISFSIVYFLPGFLAGLGLLRGKQWARIVIIVLSCFVLLLLPVGTALGGFGLWVLLGPDSKQFASGATVPGDTELPPRPHRIELSRQRGLFLAVAGVASAFVVLIGTGYRVTKTPAPPIIDSLYWGCIGVLVFVVFAAAKSAWTSGLRRAYADRIQRGEPWSDEQIEYDIDRDRLATCAHLRPIERDMRASGISVRLERGHRVSASCRIDPDALRARFELPAFVRYAEPPQQGRGFEDPPSALIACDKCQSTIDVVHPLEAKPETTLFPSSAVRAEASANPAPVDELAGVRDRIQALASIIAVPEYRLPSFGYSEENGRPHLEINGSRLDLVVRERGREYERFSTTSVDELLYRVFRDATFSMAATAVGATQITAFNRGRIVRHQRELLERLDPKWASRHAAER